VLVSNLLHSRTVWVALGQAAVAVVAALTTANPALGKVGWILVVKSVVDVGLRYLTTKPIGEGQP